MTAVKLVVLIQTFDAIFANSLPVKELAWNSLKLLLGLYVQIRNCWRSANCSITAA
jgi:hypothetical protein